MSRETYFDGSHYYALDTKAGCVQTLGLLEDELEKGILVKLPCKIGDEVYWCNASALSKETEAGKYKVQGVMLKKDGYYVLVPTGDIVKIGSRWALTTLKEAEDMLLKFKEQIAWFDSNYK